MYVMRLISFPFCFCLLFLISKCFDVLIGIFRYLGCIGFECAVGFPVLIYSKIIRNNFLA